ncbi:zinc finger protein 271-like isoform X2 [Dermacentor albipictus]|uniref:zinc finger protein 271-like isoform X2 n=1 Tax=Dermacentor albipictus TaxID=60249 RepID=UPI0038FD0BF8
MKYIAGIRRHAETETINANASTNCMCHTRSTRLLQHTSCHLGDGSSTRQEDLQSSLLPNNRSNLGYSESANVNEHYTCGYCSKVFTKRGTLTIHLRIHTGFIDVPLRLEPSPQQVLNEGRHLQQHPVCSDTTTSLTSKKKGFIVVPLQLEPSPQQGLNEGRHLQQRPVCSDPTTSLTSERKGKRLHKCIYCSKVFKQKSTLDKHLRIHTDFITIPLKLELPPQEDLSSTRDQLQASDCSGSATSHTNKRKRKKPCKYPSKCSYCNKVFDHKSSMDKHLRTHTGERPFSCQLCPMKFTQKHSAVRHMRTHTGERPFQCCFCPMAFNSKWDQKKHEGIHTRRAPQIVSLCVP